MVQRPRRTRRRKKLLGSHQRCWIWGRYAVRETLLAGRWPVLELILSDRLESSERSDTENLVRDRGISLKIVPHDELTKLCGTTEHQGYAAKMPPFPYADAAALISEPGGNPFFLLLDGLQDPHNYGAVLRSADAMSVSGVFVGCAGQAEVTSLVARSSAGAVNHVPLAQVDDLVALVKTMKDRGCQIVAASEKASIPAELCDFRRPTVLILGNEGTGIRPDLLQVCDKRVTIPQFGHVASLNAAVSAGILLYEARRQRGTALCRSTDLQQLEGEPS